MSLMTHPTMIRLRSALRAAGLTKPLSGLLGRRNYEEEVDRALLSAVRPGDQVWDVGANVGHYSSRLAHAVGPRGRVFAFEPSPLNRQRLAETASGFANIVIMPFGLSVRSGQVAFQQGADEIGATSRLSRETAGDGMVSVELHRGDEVVASGIATTPNAIKIDVEGHELEVLEGLGVVLSSPTLRAVVVEVHFGLLAKDGRADVPNRIESTLRDAGFTLRWIDRSHLLAVH